jgi:hypothetical protein
MPAAAAKLVRLLLVMRVGLLHMVLRMRMLLLLMLLWVLWLCTLLRWSVLHVCINRRCMLGIAGRLVASGR